jgi:hypothetical protein
MVAATILLPRQRLKVLLNQTTVHGGDFRSSITHGAPPLTLATETSLNSLARGTGSPWRSHAP